MEPPVSVNPAYPPTFSREYAIPTTPNHNKEVHYHYVTTPHLQVEHQVCRFKITGPCSLETMGNIERCHTLQILSELLKNRKV